MSKFSVVITETAERDIVDIYSYIAKYDTIEKAQYVLEKIENVCEALNYAPERGRRVPELVKIGVTAFRQVYYKPYRVIYQVQGSKVFVFSVLDGRRDMEEILQNKLIRP